MLQQNVYAKKLIDSNEFYKKLYRKFDKALNSCLEGFQKTINTSIMKVENRLHQCEETMKLYMEKSKKSFEDELHLAETLVNKELRSKVIMSQWTNLFLATSEQSNLDAVTFAISRFALNIALTYDSVSPDYLIQTGIPKHLINYLNTGQVLVIGPSIMALVHMSLFRELKHVIVEEGALPPILKIMYHFKSKPILSLCAKLCASLALDLSNKVVMAQSGCFHAIIDLVLGSHSDVDDSVRFYALCAIVNTVHCNDSNRLLSIELSCIKPVITVLQVSANEEILVQALRSIGNISYGNSFTANNILLGGGGEVIVEMLRSIDVNKQSALVHAALVALSNICFAEINQTHVGNVNGMLETILGICESSRAIYVVTEAANFILGCCWKNNINKSRMAHKNACAILLKRILHHSQSIDSEDIICTERLCLALSSILLYRANHERMNVVNGLQDVVKLCKQISEPILLRALSKIIIPMVPSPDELILLHRDDSTHIIEKVNAVSVLKKIKLRGYASVTNPPDWLDIAIELLSMNDYELQTAPTLVQQEFVEQLFYCKEFSAEIRADSTVFDTREFRGLIFSIY